MFRMDIVRSQLVGAKPYYTAINPGAKSVLAAKPLKWYQTFYSLKYGYDAIKMHRSETPKAEIVGSIGFSMLKRKALKPVKTRVGRMHQIAANNKHDMRRKNGIGGRGWLEPGRYEMVIVFHDANRAGPHVDVHIGRLSMIYRVKPETYSKLKYNREGMLTADSRKLLLEHVKSEIAGNSRVPQNIDHSMANARASWTHGDREGKNYGDGFTRQIISKSQVDVIKAYRDGPIEFYAPTINPHRMMYIYRLYEGTNKRAPILIWGNKSHNHPKFEDRLHLKLTDPEEIDELHYSVDMSTSTAKYDGSSCYVVINKKGTTVWSPRTSVVTGDRIEYTFKMNGLMSTTSEEPVIAMGELLFKNRWTGKYLPAATGSGILNSNQVLPKNVRPEIRLYRVDKIGRSRTTDLGFWENRKLQQQVSALNSKQLKVVALMNPNKAKAMDFEGIVAVPHGGSVNDGFKVKWWMDPHDWVINSVAFSRGEKGKVAGVVKCTSLESGKTFNLGPGQVGDEKLTTHMMANPGLYEGSVIKVNSRHGHEGRASKMIGFHADKGLAPF